MMADKESKPKKCILCRKEILERSQPYRIKDTRDIKSWNEQSINSLCQVLFKSREDSDNLKALLRDGAYCMDCRQTVWDVDLTLRTIRGLELKLDKLTNKIIRDLSVNHEKSKHQLSYDETVQAIFKALDTAKVQKDSLSSIARNGPRQSATQNPAARDFGARNVVEVEGQKASRRSKRLRKRPVHSQDQAKVTKKPCKKTAQKNFHCNRCNRDLKTSKALKTHLLYFHHIRIKCPHPNCDRIFKFNSTMKIHMENVHSSKVYPHICSICSKGFDTSDDLETHSVIHKRVNPFKCEDCLKIFSNSYDLSRHVKTSHQNLPQHVCSICTKSFPTLLYLKRHQRYSHTDIFGPLKCPFCEEKFLTLVELRKHRATHLPKKVFKCDQCGKPFTSIGPLRVHLKSHTGEKSYKCKICHKGFVYLRTRNDHEKIHSGFRDQNK